MRTDQLALLIALEESVYATFGIDERRFAGVEGVAAGTCVHVHLLQGRLRFDRVAAGTANYGIAVLWMYVFLHLEIPVECFQNIALFC